jgi:alpha-glucosidase
VRFAWPQAQGASALEGHGLAGSFASGQVSLPPSGAWSGSAAGWRLLISHLGS